MQQSALLSPLTCAYIGDAVYEQQVRLHVVAQGDKPIRTLHLLATKFSRASAQCRYFQLIRPVLSEEEVEIFKRGRNAHSRPPKNADPLEYKTATGFEALLGYLYLNGKSERIDEIMRLVFANDKEKL